MSDTLKSIWQQARDLLSRLSPGARLASGVILALVVAGLSYIVAADHTRYATLFAGLPPDDAGTIVERLRKQKIPFRLEAGGSAIRVPQEVVLETRMALAGEGLPRGGGVGLEIFDKERFGISDFAQQVNYRRALQGELERTIRGIDSVRTARVHIAMQGRQLFVREKAPATASVTLGLRSGRELSGDNVRAIVHLVSSSVAGLSAGHVTIVDTHGRLLWGGRDDGGTAAVAEKRARMARDLERRVARMLAAALGKDNAAVTVAVELATDRVERTEEKYDPDSAAVRSETRSEDQGGAPAAGGVAGSRGALAGGPPPKPPGNSSKRKVINYEISRTVLRKVSQPGGIARVSVAVLVNQKALERRTPAAGAKKDDEKGKAAAPAVSLADLTEVVKQAVGFNAARGDTVALRAVPFAPVEAGPPAAGGNPVVVFVRTYRDLIGMGAAALGGLVVTILLLLTWRKHKKRAQAEVLALPATVRQIERRQASRGGALPEGGETPALPAPPTDPTELARAAAGEDPARAAQVLRAWLAES